MDAETLRLILFLAGIGLILGIYFLGIRRKASRPVHATRRDETDEDEAYPAYEEPLDEADDFAEEKIEPTMNAGLDILAERPAGMERHPGREKATGAHSEPRASEKAPSEQEQPAQSSFSFSAVDAEEQTDIQYGKDVPNKIIQLALAAKGDGVINGEALHQACVEVGLSYGEMDIYHSMAENQPDKVIFSMANMVEPGTFPARNRDRFDTPGVVLFAQLPGPKDGLAIFADMLFSAERMAAELDAELRDETHSVLSKQTIEHIREEILEHRRQMQLASSKR